MHIVSSLASFIFYFFIKGALVFSLQAKKFSNMKFTKNLRQIQKIYRADLFDINYRLIAFSKKY